MAKHAGKMKDFDETGRSEFEPLDTLTNMAPVNPAYSAEEVLARSAAKRAAKRNRLKVAGITAGIIVAVLLAVYLAGVFVFSGRFMPNTHISDMDISFKTPDEVHAMLNDKVGGYTFEVEGQGVDEKITAQSIGLSLDGDAITDSVMAKFNPWAWPIELFQVHDETAALTEAYASESLSDALAPIVEAVNENAKAPKNATIAYDADTGAFEVVAEVYGTKLDLDKVVEQVATGVSALQAKITLTDDVLVQPTVLKDDERLAAAAKEANTMISSELQLTMDGNDVATLDGETISSWVTVDDNVEAALDADKLGKWVDTIADGCNTVGTTRTYTRPDGKKVTVSGGTYGWKIDSDGLKTAVSDAVAAGTQGEVAIPVSQSGNGFSGIGDKDWGSRYCDIDLSEQHARFYDESGALVWESDIVSGAPPDNATPTGVYVLNSKASPSTLIGQTDPATGEPEYETKVQYWMPFVGNSVGLHDATWQSAFGGSRYKQGYGSHGCVNLPLGKAEALYGIIKTGDVVVCHN